MDLQTRTVSVTDLISLDLILWEGQLAMVIAKISHHPEIMFLKSGICCSIISGGTVELVLVTERLKVEAKYPKWYEVAKQMVLEKI